MYSYKEWLKLLNEGLIKTHDLGSSISSLNMLLTGMGLNYNITKTPQNTILLEILNFSILNKEHIDYIFTIINNMGLFPSQFTIMNNLGMVRQFKWNKQNLYKWISNENISTITLTLECTFDTKIKNIPQHLYHICPDNKFKKISTIGLCPKSNSRLSDHPSRIYFFINLTQVTNLVQRFKFNDLLNNKKYSYSLLQINTDKLNIAFYDDPNYPNIGIWTYENIPPNNIILLKSNL